MWQDYKHIILVFLSMQACAPVLNLDLIYISMFKTCVSPKVLILEGFTWISPLWATGESWRSSKQFAECVFLIYAPATKERGSFKMCGEFLKDFHSISQYRWQQLVVLVLFFLHGEFSAASKEPNLHLLSALFGVALQLAVDLEESRRGTTVISSSLR